MTVFAINFETHLCTETYMIEQEPYCKFEGKVKICGKLKRTLR